MHTHGGALVVVFRGWPFFVGAAADYSSRSDFSGVALLWVLPPTITFRTAHTPPGGSPPVQHVEAAALYAAAGLRDGWDPSRGGAPFTRGQVIIGSFRRG